MIKIRRIPKISLILIAFFSLMSCVGNNSEEYAGSCDVDLSELRDGKEIDLVGDLLPRQPAMVSLRYYHSIDAVLAVSNSGKCIGRVDMLTDDVHQYDRLIGVFSAIRLDDASRNDFASFLKLESRKCERNTDLYKSTIRYSMRTRGSEGEELSHTYSREPMSICGQLISNNSYVANILDGGDMVTVDVFGSKIFVARKKWP